MTTNPLFSHISVDAPADLVLAILVRTDLFTEATRHATVIMTHDTWDGAMRSHVPIPPDRDYVVVSTDRVVAGYAMSTSITETTTVSFMPPVTAVRRFAPRGRGGGGSTIHRPLLPVWVIGGPTAFALFPNPSAVFVLGNSRVELLDTRYALIGYTPSPDRILVYRCGWNRCTFDHMYLSLCDMILARGMHRSDRTGVGTISLFGRQLRVDLKNGFPLLTTKRIPWKHVIEELLWFLRGDTDSKILEDKGVTIWKGNTSREFLDTKGLTHLREGVIGKGYGWQWRFFGAEYDQSFADTSRTGLRPRDGFDQIHYIINEIKTNPTSRRILMCTWNPCDLDKAALPPCHYACQFYVSENRYLNCMFSMRSTDVALGLPFNMASYAALTMIIAKKCGLEYGHLVFSGGDVHIYRSNIDGIRTQMTRYNLARPLPTLLLNDAIVEKDFEDITISDFELVGYFPHPAIRMEMAV